MGAAGIDSQLLGEMAFGRGDRDVIVQYVDLLLRILYACRIVVERVGGLGEARHRKQHRAQGHNAEKNSFFLHIFVV